MPGGSRRGQTQPGRGLQGGKGSGCQGPPGETGSVWPGMLPWEPVVIAPWMFPTPSSSGQGTISARHSQTTSSHTPHSRAPGQLPIDPRPTAHPQEHMVSRQFPISNIYFLPQQHSLPPQTTAPPEPQCPPQIKHLLPHASIYKIVVGAFSGGMGWRHLWCTDWGRRCLAPSLWRRHYGYGHCNETSGLGAWPEMMVGTV